MVGFLCLMHLTSIAKQFNKLSEAAEYDILSQFDKNDLKGSYVVRNELTSSVYEKLQIVYIYF